MSSPCDDLTFGRSDPLGTGSGAEQKLYNEYKRRTTTPCEYENFTPTDIFYSLSDAVVSISAFFPANQVLDTNPSVTIAQSEIHNGSGFFIDSGIVVTAAHIVVRTGPPVPTIGVTGYARASEIYVRVKNVNQKGETYIYNGVLKAVSAYFDVAILELTPPKGSCYPVLKYQPTLTWGSNRCYAIGEPCYVMGDIYRGQDVGITQGIVYDNMAHSFQYDTDLTTTVQPDDTPLTTGDRGYSSFPFEMIVTDASSYDGTSGGPIINRYGRVIGMVSGQLEITTRQNFGDIDPSIIPYTGIGGSNTVGIAEYILHYIVDVMLRGPADPCTGGHLELIRSNLGYFYRFNFGYLGADDYIANGFRVSRIPALHNYPKQNGVFVQGVDSTSAIAQLINPLNIYDLQTNLLANVPNPIDGPNGTYGELYLLTRINETPIGSSPGAIHMSSVLGMSVVNQWVKIEYRVGSQNFSCPRVMAFQLGKVPVQLDVPPSFSITTSSNQTAGARGLPGAGARGLPSAKQIFSPEHLLILKELIHRAPEMLKHLLHIKDDVKQQDIKAIVADGKALGQEVVAVINPKQENDKAPEQETVAVADAAKTTPQ